MIDTEKIQPPGKLVPKLMRPGIRIGKPLDFTRYQGMEGDRFILRSVFPRPSNRPKAANHE